MAGKKDKGEAGAGQLTDGSGEVILDAGPNADDQGDAAEGWDAEGEHQTAVERLEQSADDLELNLDELVFDIRDFLIETFKNRPKPWSGCSQAEQRDIAAACEHASKELVRKTTEAIATRGTSAIRVLLTKVNMGGDIVIQGKVKTFDEIEEDRAVLDLHRSIGKHVMLTRASADDYMGEGREADTDEDEPDFEFEAADGDEDEDEEDGE